jgi:hypothetical protein
VNPIKTVLMKRQPAIPGLAVASLLITGTMLLGTGAGASGETLDEQRAVSAKKPKPCRKPNPRPYVLCKPVVGIWSGTATQQTPSGSVAATLELRVTRKSNGKGTNIRIWSEPETLKWFCGNAETGYTTGDVDLPSPFATIGKTSGFFVDFATVISPIGNRELDFSGDFKSRTRVTGRIAGSWEAGGICPSGATLLEVTWQASPG